MANAAPKARPKSAPVGRAGPPRSGNSVFARQCGKPMVSASARKANPTSEVVERLVHGEAVHQANGLVPQCHQPPSISVRGVADPPTDQCFDSAYPRHGSIHSLQYHNTTERQGAYHAPGPGRGSVWQNPPHIWDLLEVNDAVPNEAAPVQTVQMSVGPPRRAKSAPTTGTGSSPASPQRSSCQGSALSSPRRGSPGSVSTPLGSISMPINASATMPPPGQELVAFGAMVTPTLQRTSPTTPTRTRPTTPSRKGVGEQSTPRKRSGPPRSGKSIFVHNCNKPMVAATQRKGVQLSDAMERIAKGEPAYDPRGQIPAVNKPSEIPVNAVGLAPGTYGPYHFDAAYPRAGTVNSLQYHNTYERSGAYQAPGAGRSSILCENIPGLQEGAEQPQFTPPARTSLQDSSTMLSAMTMMAGEIASSSPDQVVVSQTHVTGSIMLSGASGPTPVSGMVTMTGPNQVTGTLTLGASELDLLQNTEAQVAAQLASCQAPTVETSYGEPLAWQDMRPPPRSGKSIFVVKGNRPMVPSSVRSPVKLSPAMQRIAQGEAGHDLRGQYQKVHQPPDIPVRTVSHVPPMEQFDSAYPRHGSAHSLQYHAPVERAGAYLAPGGGRGSVWTMPDMGAQLAA